MSDSNVAVIETPGGGYDTVRSSVSYTLSDNVEKLVLTGSAHLNGTGNSGANDLFGNTGSNTLSGRNEDDYLYGRAGNDVLMGEEGNDKLYGEEGNDQLIGGLGADRLEGGSGADTFIFTNVDDSKFAARDKVIGFSGAEGDRIDTSAIDANVLLAGRQAFTFVGAAVFTAAGQLRFDKGILSGAVNGDGIADFGIDLGTVTLTAEYLIL